MVTMSIQAAIRNPAGRARLLGVGLAAAFCVSFPSEGAAQGVAWQPIGLDAALDQAQRTGQLVLVYVRADHCGQCEQMRIDVWDQKEGAALADGLIPIEIDSTTPAGGALNQRFPITGLPTVLFLSPDGVEVDRVVGYHNARSFLAEAEPLKSGSDPLPGLEAQLAAHPDSVPLIVPVLERYLHRMREKEAEALAKRLVELDPSNRSIQPEIALRSLANYYAIRMNTARSHEYWTELLHRYPECSSAGGAVEGARKAAVALGRLEQWKTSMCGLVQEHPGNGRLLYAIAMSAHRYGIRGACFAEAARRAGALGVGGARMDSIAARLGAPPGSGR